MPIFTCCFHTLARIFRSVADIWLLSQVSVEITFFMVIILPLNGNKSNTFVSFVSSYLILDFVEKVYKEFHSQKSKMAWRFLGK